MSLSPTQLDGIEKLKQVLPTAGWSEDPKVLEPHLKEWRDRWQGQTPLMLMPKTTGEVSTAVSICSEHQLKITPQGGNTGLVGGQIPQGEILLSTKRMNAVRVLDNETITVEAGCILENIQSLAGNTKQLFPLSLASQGSATIGGLCATNAGGVHVVRYGSMRELVVGLEVVLADGSIINTLNALKKDNTGYNLTPLFVGSEGTLGIITAAQLKLFPKPVHTETVLTAVESVDKALELFDMIKRIMPDKLSMIELIPQTGIEFVTRHIPGGRSPFEENYPWYVLLEFEFGNTSRSKSNVEKLITKTYNKKIVLNAVHAESLAQARELLNLREHISEAQKPEGASIKHDISVPVSKIPEFIHKATIAAISLEPGCRPVPFGHIGDGNIHFNITQPSGMDKAIFLSNWKRMNRLIHDLVIELGGSISAEHGIGILKKQELAERGDAIKLNSMKQIKQALDPDNLMNPRVLFV